jgi:integrase
MNSETVAQALARWLLLAVIDKKPNTIHYYREVVSSIRCHWKDCLDKPADSITSVELTEFVTRVSRYSPSRFNAMVFALRTFIPAAKALRTKKLKRFDTTKVPTPKQFEALIAVLDGAARGHAGLVIRFLSLTGLRIGEAGSLTWNDVKPECIMLPASVTKNGRPRSVPLVEGVQPVLDSLRRIAAESGSNQVLPQQGCYRAVRYACDLLSLPRVSHHAFRHYFTTRSIEAGVDVATVAKVLGHQDGGALLLRNYCHILDEHVATQMAKVKISSREIPAHYSTRHPRKDSFKGREAPA